MSITTAKRGRNLDLNLDFDEEIDTEIVSRTLPSTNRTSLVLDELDELDRWERERTGHKYGTEKLVTKLSIEATIPVVRKTYYIFTGLFSLQMRACSAICE